MTHKTEFLLSWNDEMYEGVFVEFSSDGTPLGFEIKELEKYDYFLFWSIPEKYSVELHKKRWPWPRTEPGVTIRNLVFYDIKVLLMRKM